DRSLTEPLPARRSDALVSNGVLRDKAVVVTGAGRGIGRAIALHAATEGASVVVNDIDAYVVSEVVSDIEVAGGSAVGCGSSVSMWDGAAEIIDCCVRTFGSIDGLVNNAAVLDAVLPWETDERQIRRTIEINLLGTLFCGTHAMSAMKAQGHGAIVNLSSR